VSAPSELEERVTEGLRQAGARFAFVHGSRAVVAPDRDLDDSDLDESDLDVGAWWGREHPPAPWDAPLPDGVDLLVLDDAPLELAGRVALSGRLLFDDDPPARVRWQAQTRLVYLDEEPRQRELDRLYLSTHAHGR
jgi:hypothetical protein